MDENFGKDWRHACNHFTVLEHNVFGVPGLMTRYLHAEADTGSRYEIISTEMLSPFRRADGPTNFISVVLPWAAVWTADHGSIIYPNYALEHWRSPRRTLNEMHGGDSAALPIGLNIICGSDYDVAVGFAKSFYAAPEED
jgi:hypothetical protein